METRPLGHPRPGRDAVTTTDERPNVATSEPLNVPAPIVESSSNAGVEPAAVALESVAAPGGLPSDQLARLAAAAAHTAAADPGTGSVLSTEAMARVLAAVDASTAAATKTAYRSDWHRFQSWCEEHGYPALPAAPAVVAAYITAAAVQMRTDRGRFAYAPASLTRWVSSINQVHGAAGHPAPGRTELVRRALAGIRRVRATPPKRVAPLLLDDIRAILTAVSAEAGGWPSGVAARRDTALLLFGFAGAFRRGELVALTLADVTLHRTDGLHVRVRRSKTDQQAHGHTKALPYGRDPQTCAPCAWTRWRQVLDAWDTADPDAGRRAVLTVLHRQAKNDHATADASGTDDVDQIAGGSAREKPTCLHVCRTTGVPPVSDDSARAQRPLFPGVHKTGAIADTPLTGEAVRKVIQRRGSVAGLTDAHLKNLGGHSLRAGFVTEAFRQGADAHAIMRQTGHRNPAMLEVYAREHAPLIGNAVTTLGL